MNHREFLGSVRKHLCEKEDGMSRHGGGGKSSSGGKSSGGGKSNGGGKAPMSPQAASRIQSSTATHNGGSVPKGSFASRAQRAADKNDGGKK